MLLQITGVQVSCASQQCLRSGFRAFSKDVLTASLNHAFRELWKLATCWFQQCFAPVHEHREQACVRCNIYKVTGNVTA